MADHEDLAAAEFLLATRARYELHFRTAPPAPSAESERDAEQDLRAVDFLVATRTHREAVERVRRAAVPRPQPPADDRPAL